MRATFVYTLKTVVRETSVLEWAIIFPLVLYTLFYVMFANLDSVYQALAAPVVVVQDQNFEDAPGLAELIDAVAGQDQPWLDPTYVDSAAEAAELVDQGGYYGYIAVDAQGALRYDRDWREYGSTDPGHGIVEAICSGYLQNVALIRDLAAADPAAVSNPALMERLATAPQFTKAVQLTANRPSDSVRYFYAAMGFAAFQAGSFALVAMGRLKPNVSAVGGRRTVAALPRGRQIAASLGASWVLALATLLVGFAYLRLALSIEFGGKELGVVATLAVASLVATAVGAAMGSLPIRAAAASGLAAVVACALSLFAGLYGQGSQDLGDLVAEHAPWSAWANPVRQVYDALFSLYCYDTYGPMLRILAQLAVLGLAAAAVVFLVSRRQRYEHL
ncbi:MAG: ABC transporter permease [Bifidobacteriaceae bacterium]|jgi:hypothetical protein|nr:ABC transporter permease [Bifidobacteriaceae bacterium]